MLENNSSDPNSYFKFSADLNVKKVIPLGESIVKIACGACHLVLLTSNNRVFVYGRNSRYKLFFANATMTHCVFFFKHSISGQLGLGKGVEEVTSLTSLRDVSSQKDIFSAENTIVDIACGFQHTLILFSNGTVFATGDNSLRYVLFFV